MTIFTKNLEIPSAGSSFLQLPESSNSAKHTYTHNEIQAVSFPSRCMEPIKNTHELPGSSNSAKHTHTHEEILSNSFFISQ
jgi:hypothetical protein